MTVVSLDDFRQRLDSGSAGSRTITFRSATFHDGNGNSTTLCINVVVKDGDAIGILNAVMEQGGVGQVDEYGVYRFIPWPCACVEINAFPCVTVDHHSDAD